MFCFFVFKIAHPTDGWDIEDSGWNEFNDGWEDDWNISSTTPSSTNSTRSESPVPMKPSSATGTHQVLSKEEKQAEIERKREERRQVF